MYTMTSTDGLLLDLTSLLIGNNSSHTHTLAHTRESSYCHHFGAGQGPMSHSLARACTDARGPFLACWWDRTSSLWKCSGKHFGGAPVQHRSRYSTHIACALDMGDRRLLSLVCAHAEDMLWARMWCSGSLNGHEIVLVTGRKKIQQLSSPRLSTARLHSLTLSGFQSF
jgi:hypothetical protein